MRVKRGEPPKETIRASNYRKVALSSLRRDFANRCAYSMQHESRAGGIKCMEIDHFDPNQKHNPEQDYENLFLSSRHCNNSKLDFWPDENEQRLGFRLLNPCREFDYAIEGCDQGQMFEEVDTGELVGSTPAARTHIWVCDLNAPHLVEERRERAEIVRRLKKLNDLSRQIGRPEAPFDWSEFKVGERRILEKMIPPIQPPKREI